MDAEGQAPQAEDQDPTDWHELLESRVHPLFAIRPGPPAPLTPTHLALTHLLHRHRVRCTNCLHSRHRHHHPTRPPSFHAVDALANLTLTRLGVMSQSRLLQYLDVIARDWVCRRCRRSKTVHVDTRRIAVTWVRELRRVVAMLSRILDSQAGLARPEFRPIDLTRTPPRSHDTATTTCVICTDAILDPAGEKTCFQCGGVIHQSCFEQYRREEDLHQLPTLDGMTERDVLRLTCVFCRCVVLEVGRSEEGRRAWGERKRESERADEEFAWRLVWEEEVRRRRRAEEEGEKENVEPEGEGGEDEGWGGNEE